MIISSKDASEPSSATADTTSVSVGLTLEVRTIIAVNYRNGAQRTGVSLGELTAVTTADSLVLRAPMQRTGTAAWIGLTTVKLLNEAGAVVATQTLQTAVYQSMAPRFAFSRGTLPPGRYRISVDLNTDRPDVTQTTLLRAPPQHAETTVTIPANGS
jgi:outer membrane usher protein FimD/PapC